MRRISRLGRTKVGAVPGRWTPAAKVAAGEALEARCYSAAMSDMPDLALADDAAAALRTALPALPADLIRELAERVAEAGQAGTLSSQVDQLEALVVWLGGPIGFDLPPDAPLTGRSPAARLWVLHQLCDVHPPSRQSLARLFNGAMPAGAAVNLLVHGGLARQVRLLGELTDRLLRRVLPQPPDDGDLAAMLPRLFPNRRSTEWFEHAPPQLVEDLFGLLIGPSGQARLQDDLIQAISLLAIRSASLGLEEDTRVRGPDPRPTDSAFLALPAAALELAHVSARQGDLLPAQREAAALVKRAREAQDHVARHLDRGGISVDLVFRVELLARTLHRLERLCWLLDRGPEDGPAAVRLVRDLVRTHLSDRSVGVLLRENSTLLARRVIERAGETGEHYITHSRREWNGMLRSAAGGGVLTAGTAMVKLWVTGAHLPAFIEFVATWVNYSGSFLMMQGLDFTLATKQPAMTAATIAAELGGGSAVDDTARAEGLADLVARTARSQFAAALGNLAAVIPTALALDFAWRAATGHSWLPEEKAVYVVQSLHPWQSASALYAVETAGVLWLGSILAGTVENWTAVRRIPEAIGGHRGLRRLFGDARAGALAASFSRNVAGVAGNLWLGLLMAALPVAGVFFGLPLDVRHVTLSTGSLALAASQRGWALLLTPEMGYAAAGVLVVLLLNFTVSFNLALAVAMRARGVSAPQLAAANRALLRRFFRHPLQFLIPPADGVTTPPASQSGSHGG